MKGSIHNIGVITILENDDKVIDKFHDMYWQRETIELSTEQRDNLIKALQEGKAIGLSDGEGSTVVRLVKEE